MPYIWKFLWVDLFWLFTEVREFYTSQKEYPRQLYVQYVYINANNCFSYFYINVRNIIGSVGSVTAQCGNEWAGYIADFEHPVGGNTCLTNYTRPNGSDSAFPHNTMMVIG